MGEKIKKIKNKKHKNTFYGSFYFFMKKILLAFLNSFVLVSSKVLIVSIISGVEIVKSLASLGVFVVVVVVFL